MKTTFLMIITIGLFSSFFVFDSNAEELYFEADFDFFNERLEEDRKYRTGDTINIVGHSSFYKEETNEHFPAPGSEFHVVIKNPENEIIHEDYLISDSEGKMEFPFTILNDYPIGEYVVEMTVNKQKHLDLSFFVGHQPDSVVKTDETFVLWMDDSEIVSPLNAQLMGVLCSDKLKESTDRKSVFLDPYDDHILEVHSVDIKAYFTDPNGEKTVTISNPEKNLCTNFSNSSPYTHVTGEWSVYATALWMEDETLYEASSHTVTFQVKEPLFQGMIEKIPLKNSWGNVTPLDWSGDGESILFTYTLPRDESHFPQLATMSLDDYGVTTLDIPMLFDTDEQIRSAKFSPDGKFIHFVADDGNLFRYEFGTSHTLKLTHHSEWINFDYYSYSQEDPTKYSIIVSVDKRSYLEDSSENGYILFDIGNGEGQDSILDAHALVFNFESLDFDISPDGKKILFQKTIESDYGWADRILAYHPAQGDIVEIPNSQVNCGAPPKWAPSGDIIVYDVHFCGRGAPDGTLHLISDDGSYHELILPYDNYNPDSFVISPDGTYLLYVKGSNFEMMTLAKPIPEFETIVMMILVLSALPIVLLRKQVMLK